MDDLNTPAPLVDPATDPLPDSLPDAMPDALAPAQSQKRLSFFDDFRRFFMRGLAAILPTIITLGLLVWVWNFLWDNVGSRIIQAIRWIWLMRSIYGSIPYTPPALIGRQLNDDDFSTRALGVGLALLLIYVVGVFVGNLLGRTAWRLAEFGVMRIPLVRAIYPAVKQVTDFLLSERSAQFQGSKVVAVEPHEKGIWSIGLVTGDGLRPLSEATGRDMITVFIPSSPTAFSGYVLVVPRDSVVELPLKVEEVMRLLVSGGVISPDSDKRLAEAMRFPGAKSGAKSAAKVKQPPAA
jgi:uncharacterized membrane protein